MYRYIQVNNIRVPVYGLMVILSISIGNILLKLVCKRKKLDINTACVLEIYGGVGAILGAKVLAFLESYWFKRTLIEELLTIRSGYSFYGGLLLGLGTIYIGCWMHKIKFDTYSKELCFVIPIMHSIWKLGCYFAGCCYGVETDSIVGQKFPEGAVAPSDVNLIPVQLIECMCLVALSIVLWYLNYRKKLKYPISTYLVGYSTPRFFIEFFRFNEKYGNLSIAQWISLVCVSLVILNYTLNIRRRFRR